MEKPNLAVSAVAARGWGERFRLREGLIVAILVAICLVRLAYFIPQPLDSPGTLRPILYRWWLWFVTLHAHPEQAFSSWSTIAFVALMIYRRWNIRRRWFAIELTRYWA